jgi:hypothetical protein
MCIRALICWPLPQVVQQLAGSSFTGATVHLWTQERKCRKRAVLALGVIFANGSLQLLQPQAVHVRVSIATREEFTTLLTIHKKWTLGLLKWVL